MVEMRGSLTYQTRDSLFRCWAELYASTVPHGMFHDKISQGSKYAICPHKTSVDVCTFNNVLKHCKMKNIKIKRLAFLHTGKC
jgi:hypothetical protein